jgi:hypothetical protein
LFLVTVSDADGLSYYSDVNVGRLLSMEPSQVERSRRTLCQAGLLAYRQPFYQVLSLEKYGNHFNHAPCEHPQPHARGGDEMVSVGQILRQALGGAS